MVNELQNNEQVDVNTGEILSVEPTGEKIVEETDDFRVVQMTDGTFKRKAKFHDYSSFTPKDRDERLWLLNLIDSDNDDEVGQGMAENVGEKIEVEHVIFRRYSNIDEKTGETIEGVLTYLITPEREAYVTSSKSVYFTMRNILDLFGTPESEDWQNVVVQIKSERTQNGTAIRIKMIA